MALLKLQTLKPVRVIIILLLTTLPYIVQSQSNSAQDPANANALTTIFYFDSNSDCNGPIRQLYGFEGTIRGFDITSTRLGPKSCTIRLQSTGQFVGTVLEIEVKAMTIRDRTTLVSIYDGDGSQISLISYDYNTDNQNKKLILTSGDTATFIMIRDNVNSFNFDIEIKINPRRGSIDPGYENNYGSGYFFDKFSQPTIVGMIGGFYSLIVVICTAIIIKFCCKYHKLDKKWETQQLSTIKPGAVFESKSQPSNAWSVEMKQSQGPGSQFSVGVINPHSRKTGVHNDDGDSVLYNGDALQKKRLMTLERDKSRPSHASNNTSFTDPEDDSDHFVEKIITPRVKSRNKQLPSYDHALSSQTSDHSSDEGSEVSTSESSIRKRPLSSEEERSEKSTATCTQSETESDRSGHRARTHKHKGKPQKSRKIYSNKNDSIPSTSNNSHQQLPQHQMQQVSYGAYPPGQFVPVMVGPNQFQQVAMVPSAQPVNYPEQAAAPPKSQVHPTEPPVYSYLVRRGYTPLDARSSSAVITSSTQRPGGGHLQDPELRLESGVEYMRR
uniref:CUB domain-containing protein n=1 Tax=Arion vulgaris TaxID=1028688 RepID=A0A0B6ZEA1_9EUPU